LAWLDFPCKSIVVVRCLEGGIAYVCPSAQELLVESTVRQARGLHGRVLRLGIRRRGSKPSRTGWIAVPPPLPGPCRATRSKTH